MASNPVIVYDYLLLKFSRADLHGGSVMGHTGSGKSEVFPIPIHPIFRALIFFRFSL
jgi:hypothetical protein